MSDGPPSAGVALINKHGAEHYKGWLNCSWTEEKGRIVHATRDFKQGEVILIEEPLHIVQEDKKSAAFKKVVQLCRKHESSFDYDPLWYWCALQSLTRRDLKEVKATGLEGTSEETQQKLLLLHHPLDVTASAAAELLVKELTPNADLIILERLIQIWVLNCFEYSDSPQGYSTYFFSSFMSHSCFPNAFWHYVQNDHLLRARRDIKQGDEVCISYLTEDCLLQSSPVRRWDLHETKRFWCSCERCASTQDISRGLWCPKCHKGIVFGKGPGVGPATSSSLLPSALLGAACNACGHALTRAEVDVLAGKEKKVEDTTEKLADLMKNQADDDVISKEAQALEDMIDTTFAQHVLADLACEKLAEFYATRRRAADQRRVLARRCAFHKAAYPGLSASHAWALEAYADLLRRPGGDQQQARTRKKGTGKVWQAPTKAEPEQAFNLYTEALRILKLMFGEDHEYITNLDSKHRGLQRLLCEKA